MRIVAHNTQPVVQVGQLLHYEVLRKVGVLILVNQNILEKLLVFLPHVIVVAQQNVGVKQQVVEVHCSGCAASVPIALVYFIGERALCLLVLFAEVALARVVGG